jgi:hypothetical protein
LLLSKNEIELRDVRVEIAAHTAANTCESLGKVPVLRRSEALLAENSDYQQYVHNVGAQLMGNCHPSQSYAQPISGPLGAYMQVTLHDDKGSRRRQHDRDIMFPLRAWHVAYAQRTGQAVAPAAQAVASLRDSHVRPLAKARGGDGCANLARSVISATAAANLIERCSACGMEMCKDQVQGHWYCPVDGSIKNDNCSMLQPYGTNADDCYLENDRPGYRRINRFMETFRRDLGIEAATIPRDVFEQVRTQWNKRCTYITADDITGQVVRDWLKICGLPKWYDHSERIARFLTDRPEPDVTVAQIAKLRKQFDKVQAEFDARPSNVGERENFVKYSYVIYKLCEMNGYTNLLPYFSLLKDPERLSTHDQVWEYVCIKLKWAFIRTPRFFF